MFIKEKVKNITLEGQGHNAHSIATVILNKRNNKFTPLQINKLIYFSHGWLLGIHDEPLVTEKVEAWKFGPVIPSIYYLFKGHGIKPVNLIDYFDSVYDGLDNKAEDIIDQVIDNYGELSGSELIEITHRPGTPWAQYYKEGVRDIIIPDDAIKEFFKRASEE